MLEWIVRAALAAAVLAACGSGAPRSSGGAFYAGKTIRIIVPTGPGGTTDITARLFAQQVRDYIPGRPAIVVENQEGGGNSVGIRNLTEHTPPDGLNLVSIPASAGLRWLLREPGHTYPLDKMPAVGSLPGGQVTMSRTDVAPDLDTFIRKGGPYKMGGTAPGGQGQYAEVLLGHLMGFKTQHVFGFGSFAEVALAVERGELPASTTGDLNYVQSWLSMVNRKVIVPLFQGGLLTEKGEVIRSPLVPDVPTAYEQYKRLFGKDPAGEDWEAYKVVLALNSASTALFMHPDTPSDRLAILREAFSKATADQKWADDTKKSLGAPQPAIDGQRTNDILKGALSPSPRTIEIFKQALAEG